MIDKIHPLADTLPLMSDAEYRDLLADIRANGLLEPITLYENKVLDSRNRLRACREAGIEPRFVDFTGSDPAAYVLSKNIQRRHLTPGQKAMALLKMDAVVRQIEAPKQERKLKNLRRGKQAPIPSRDGIGEKEVVEGTEAGIHVGPAETPHENNKHAHTTAAKLGELADISEKTMERAKYVLDHGTAEDVQEVESGGKTVHRKAKEIRARQNHHTKAGTRKASQERKRNHLDTKEEVIVREWKSHIEIVKHTLPLDPSKLPPGKKKDEVARLRCALEGKALSQHDRDAMKEAVGGLRDRCHQVLRALASAKDRGTTTASKRSTARRGDPFGGILNCFS